MHNEIIKKLSIDKFEKKLFLHKPADILDFEGFTYAVNMRNEKYDMVFTFIFSLVEFVDTLKTVIDRELLNPNGVVYFAYPKKGNKQYKTYIGRDDFFGVAEMDDDGYVFSSDIKFFKMAAYSEVFTVIGLKREEKRKKSTQPSQCVGDYIERIPDLKRHFAHNTDVLTFFERLTPGYQRGWARYVYGVKNPATTEKRLLEMESIIKQGYKSVDLYRQGKVNF